MSKKTLILLSVFLASILGGAIVPTIKISLKTIPPLTFTFIRFLIAFVFLLPLFLKEKPKLKNLPEVVLVSLFSTANIILFIFAVRFIPANIGQLIYVTTPIIVGILSYFIIKEKITVNKTLGIILGFLGALFLLFSKTVVGFSFRENIVGMMMIFVGAILYSFYLVFSKKLQKKYSPIYITTVFNLTTMLTSLLFLFSEFNSISFRWSDINLGSFTSILYVSIVGTSLYYLLGQYVVKYGSPLLSSIIQYVQVPFTVIWASLLIGERITNNFFISALMIVIGSVLVSRNKNSINRG